MFLVSLGRADTLFLHLINCHQKYEQCLVLTDTGMWKINNNFCSHLTQAGFSFSFSYFSHMDCPRHWRDHCYWKILRLYVHYCVIFLSIPDPRCIHSGFKLWACNCFVGVLAPLFSWAEKSKECNLHFTLLCSFVITKPTKPFQVNHNW